VEEMFLSIHVGLMGTTFLAMTLLCRKFLVVETWPGLVLIWPGLEATYEGWQGLEAT
jgi:hypothetical protein